MLRLTLTACTLTLLSACLPGGQSGTAPPDQSTYAITMQGHDGAAYGQVWSIRVTSNDQVECATRSATDPTEQSAPPLTFRSPGLFALIQSTLADPPNRGEETIFTGSGTLLTAATDQGTPTRPPLPAAFFTDGSNTAPLSRAFMERAAEHGPCFLWG
ncbi:hypothetical protein IV417_11360 [Alphaproteobacteria bacterium KMM 3653]|uniref:Lipoprotein n=1 Tax=Harenicola maris TaxID=2841044 RepID=A0AAP2CQH2_9RHOB|nr:hypothetical protein [Harenicola maris]